MPRFDMTRKKLFSLFPEFAGLRVPNARLPHWGSAFGPVSNLEECGDRGVVWVRTGGATDRPLPIKVQDPDLLRQAMALLKPNAPVGFLTQVRPIEGEPGEVEVIARHFEFNPEARWPRWIPYVCVTARVHDVRRRGPVREIDLDYPVAKDGQADEHEWVSGRTFLTPTLCNEEDGVPEHTEALLQMLVGPAGWSASDSCCLLRPKVLPRIPLPT